jgi:endonuclease-3 related protein
MNPAVIRDVYQRLYGSYGQQHWWPGETPFEVMVGSVLTQNTAWINVEKAIRNLQAVDCLSASRIDALPIEELAELIRPCGYFNLKAQRLKNFCTWYLQQGEFAGLLSMDTGLLRHALLGINGIGPETADDMLLYAFLRPVFVIDAYTRRIFSRLGLIEGDETYETLRGLFEMHLGPDLDLFNEYHALLVIHAKQVCAINPLCEKCSLQDICQTKNGLATTSVESDRV